MGDYYTIREMAYKLDQLWLHINFLANVMQVLTCAVPGCHFYFVSRAVLAYDCAGMPGEEGGDQVLQLLRRLLRERG